MSSQEKGLGMWPEDEAKEEGSVLSLYMCLYNNVLTPMFNSELKMSQSHVNTL